jgi:hypothetical protein
MLEAALHDLEAVWTTQSAPIVEYLAEGSSPESTRQRAAAFGLTLPEDVVAWFAWHDGLKIERNREVEMLPAMRPLTLDEALTLAREIKAALAPVPDVPTVLAGDWLPILSDDAGEFLFLSVEPGSDRAVRAFELSDPTLPQRRFDDLIGLARALTMLFQVGLYRFEGGSVHATDPLAVEQLIASFRADDDSDRSTKVEAKVSAIAPTAESEVDNEAAARLTESVATLEGLPRAERLIEAIEQSGRATVIEALRRLEVGAREEAASSLGYTESPKAAPLLLALLDDPEDYVRETAAGAIGMVGDQSVGPRLIPLLSSANKNLRKAAAFSLGELRTKDAVAGLCELASDRIPVVRATAATALGKIGAPVDIAPLIALLDDSYREAAQMAAWALGEIGDPAAIKPLEKATRSTDPTLARVAEEALSSLRSRE